MAYQYDSQLIDRSPGASPGLEVWDYSLNGVWTHLVFEKNFITDNGDLDVRLLFREKYAGREQALAWDNVTVTVTLPCNPV